MAGRRWCRVYGKQFNITKLKEIIPGGKDAQESTYHGLQLLKDRMGAGDIVVVHDAIRPMVSEELITDSIKVCRKKGMGVAGDLHHGYDHAFAGWKRRISVDQPV